MTVFRDPFRQLDWCWLHEGSLITTALHVPTTA